MTAARIVLALVGLGLWGWGVVELLGGAEVLGTVLIVGGAVCVMLAARVGWSWLSEAGGP